MLAVARAIGDQALMPYVTAEPYVAEFDLTESDECLILGCGTFPTRALGCGLFYFVLFHFLVGMQAGGLRRRMLVRVADSYFPMTMSFGGHRWRVGCLG